MSALLNGRIWTFYQFEDSFKPNSYVAGGSEPSSTSCRRHAICNPMLAERDVQTETYLKGIISLNYRLISYSTLLYQSQCLKAEDKYETKILK